jgi:Ca-activated chloride channel family protein
VAGDKVAGPEYGASGDVESTPTPTPTASASTPSGPKTEAGGKVGDTQPVKDDSSSALPWIILGVVLVLIVVGVGTVLVVRRRKPPTPPTYPNGPGSSWPSRP